jgi:hypothetical protein
MTTTAPTTDTALPACGCTADVPCLDHVGAVSAAFLARPIRVDEVEIREAVAFLDTIDDRTWGRIVGQQSRDEFALLASDQGEDIRDAWSEAVAHAATL